jgi:vacuolar-type H+-ATPase subunit H
LNAKATGGTWATSTADDTLLHNEEQIQQVLEIESQAWAIYEAAKREAEELPRQVEQETQALIEKARTAAQEEAHRLVANAQAPEESARILAQADEEVRRTEALAQSHFDQAVGYVLDRVVGRK